MPAYETRTGQFGLVSSIRQATSDLITIVEPSSLFAPEARKGQLYIVTEADQDIARGTEACQLVAQTLRKVFYEDESYSVTTALRSAMREANKTLYQHNLKSPVHRRAHVGVTCAVFKGTDLFIAQVGPAQAYIRTSGTLRALPAPAQWNAAHISAAPFMSSSALGGSLFVEPELYRNSLQPGDAALICSSNLTPLLSRELVEQTLAYQDPSAAIDSLATLCRQHELSEAHSVMVEVLPPLSAAARSAPLSPEGVGERGRLALRNVGVWFAGMTGEAARTVRPRRKQRDKQEDVQPERAAANGDAADAQAHPSAVPPPRPRPIDLGENLEERHQRRLAEQRPASHTATEEYPASVLLGEDEYGQTLRTVGQRIDLSDMGEMNTSLRSYRLRYEQRPLVDLTLSERLALPFQRTAVAFSDLLDRSRKRRVAPPPTPVVRSQELSYRRQKPPFPWLLLAILGLAVTLLILYGMTLSRQSAQQRAVEYLQYAEQRLAEVRVAPEEAIALERLEVARQAIDEVQASPLVTTTNVALWVRYQELQREYERALAAVQRLTFFANPEVLATHPLPNGRFASVVAPLPTSATGITDTTTIAAQRYFYAIDGDQENARLYRIPLDGGSAQPYLSPNDAVQSVQVGSVRAQAWRVDNVVVVDQSASGAGYYFRANGDWNYTRLGGSEVWVNRSRLDLETYEGNLYVWGALPGEILKYSSGRYGDQPEFWIDATGMAGRDVTTAIDMGIDGNIYLLMPDGRIIMLNGGRFVNEIVPEAITPPLTAVTRFFVTGPPDSGWFFLLDTLNERVIQVDKTSGEVIQQIRVQPEGDLRLNQLTDLFVDTSSSRPIIYLVNGGQIVRAETPAPPRPFRQTDAAPTPAP